jgi:hypothetical protein
VNLRLLRLVPIVMLAVLGAGQAGADRDDNPGVAPRGSSPHGMTYEEWAGALLHWAYSQPVGVSPFIDSTGKLTQQANSGRVCFLPGPSELLPQPENLSLTMPEGTALFFSPLGFYGLGPSPGPCPTPCLGCSRRHQAIRD